jgi:hypothetical protein
LHRGLGIASFIVGLVALVLWFVFAGLAAYLSMSRQATPALNAAVGMGMFLCFTLELVAIGTGIAGLCDKGSKKTFSVIGILISVVPLALVLALIGYARLGNQPVTAAAGPAAIHASVPNIGCAVEEHLRSMNSAIPTEITFINNSTASLRVYWLSFQGKRVFFAEVKPGNSSGQKTFVSHPWLVASSPAEECLGIFMAGPAPGTVVIQKTPSAPKLRLPWENTLLHPLLRPLAQHEFLDLAGRGLRQRAEDDVAGGFEVGEVGAAEGDDVVAGRGGAVL